MREQGWLHRKIYGKLSAWGAQWAQEDPRLDQMRINQGRILAELNFDKKSASIRDYEFKVFSQWGEDGIIQHLIQNVRIANTTFIEFGVENFSEANCRFLLMNNNWAGHVIDGSTENIRQIERARYFWKHQLTTRAAFIDRENINSLLGESGFDRDLGILSIDIDGVDYWILKAINVYRPRIMILEYNAVFGYSRKITVPYNAKFNRTTQHYSNLYFGASLPALADLATTMGYSLVGVNSAGVNAFFLRADLVPRHLRALSAEEAFVDSRIRESRDAFGQLTLLSADSRIECIRGMPVVNIETNETENI